MKSLFKWITTIFVTAILIVFAYSSINGVVAQTTSPNLANTSPSPNLPQNSTLSKKPFCNLSDDSISDDSIRKATNVELKSNFRFLAGDSIRTIEIPLEDPNTNTTVCNAVLIDAKKLKNSKPVDVVQSILSTNGRTIIVTLRIPDVGWWSQKRLLLRTSVRVANQISDEPLSVLASQVYWVSPRIMSGFLTLLILLGFYLLAVLGGTKLNTNYNFNQLLLNPVALTSGPFGKANLSMFQIFGFTLVILVIVSYIYLRNGVLTPLSDDTLQLLGISGTNAALAKVVQVTKKRLSFDNWAWLRFYKWLTIREKGYQKEPKIEDAKWIDLLKTDDSFNVYSFQLAGFSLIVAIYLITGIFLEVIGSEFSLEAFKLPENFLYVLGLSNGLYLAGRAVEPGSYEELDQKITKLRELADRVTPKDDNSLDQSQGYRKYIDQAFVVAKMLESLYGQEGIFQGKGVQVSDLEKPLIAPHHLFISFTVVSE
jgi:hypothetical protein